MSSKNSNKLNRRSHITVPIKCPCCDSRNIIARQRTVDYYCRRCGYLFTKEELKEL